MQKTTAIINFCCFAVLISCCLIGYTNTRNTKAERSPVGTLTKAGISTQGSERDFAEFTTTLSNIDATESAEIPSATQSPGLVTKFKLGRSCWIIFTACFGVLFLILMVMFTTGCLKINRDFFRNHCGSQCPRQGRESPESVIYSITEFTKASLPGNISQENGNSESNESSDSLPELIPEHLVESSEFRTFKP